MTLLFVGRRTWGDRQGSGSEGAVKTLVWCVIDGCVQYLVMVGGGPPGMQENEIPVTEITDLNT